MASYLVQNRGNLTFTYYLSTDSDYVKFVTCISKISVVALLAIGLQTKLVTIFIVFKSILKPNFEFVAAVVHN
jgi:hypothetical protein